MRSCGKVIGLGILTSLGGWYGCSKPSAGTTGGDCNANEDCDAGQACINHECVQLCGSDSDCHEGYICRDEICVPGERTERPVIAGIDGDGSADADSSHTEHHLAHHLTIFGDHLEGAQVTLADGTESWDLDICSSAPDQLEVALPADLSDEASYVLTVATQAGSCTADLPVLQGEPGAAGSTGPTGPTGPSGVAGPVGPKGDAGGGLALSLEFDEAGGPASFSDSSPYAQVAVTAGPGGVAGGSTGHSGYAVNFSGGVVTIPAPNQIPDSPRIWVEAWIEPQAPMDEARVIAMKEGAFTLKQVGPDVSLEIVASTDVTPECSVLSTGELLQAGEWSHVAGWYDGLSVTVAVNGMVRGQTGCPKGPLASSAPSAVHVGGDLQDDNSVIEPFKGTIDSVHFWHLVPQSYAPRGPYSNIVNVTVHTNNVRTPLSSASTILMESFVVDKKSPTSLLLVEGTISGHQNYSGEMTQRWTYGEVPFQSQQYAQGLMYDENVAAKIYSTSAVISGHTTTGPQNLVFEYCNPTAGGTNNRPFVTYNPNGTDQNRLYQTQSVYRVWEIEPAF